MRQAVAINVLTLKTATSTSQHLHFRPFATQLASVGMSLQDSLTVAETESQADDPRRPTAHGAGRP